MTNAEVANRSGRAAGQEHEDAVDDGVAPPAPGTAHDFSIRREGLEIHGPDEPLVSR